MIDLLNICRISSIYIDLNAAFETADVASDISWWSVNCGTEMPTKWPEFEVNIEQQELYILTVVDSPWWGGGGVFKYISLRELQTRPIFLNSHKTFSN